MKEKLSLRNQTIIYCFNKGYRVKEGIVYDPNGNPIKAWLDTQGYYLFSPSNSPYKDKNIRITIHRFVAYQKYGEKIFEEGIEVRHKDNDKLNNLDENILIGTHQQNMLDIPAELRSYYAGKNNSKYDDDKVKEYHRKTRSYKKTMEKFDISSKGTLHHILNKC